MNPMMPNPNNTCDPLLDAFKYSQFQCRHKTVDNPPTLKITNRMPSIKRVIFHNPATIVEWNDGDKTVVKAIDKADFNEEVGLAMAISKKYCQTLVISPDRLAHHPRATFKELVKRAKRIPHKDQSEEDNHK